MSGVVLLGVSLSGALPVQNQSGQDPMIQHYEGAQTALRSGDQQRGAAEYKAFLSEAIHRVANARARAGDLTEAQRLFEEALIFADSDSTLHLDYASVLFDAARFQEAESAARSALSSEPNNARAHLLLGRVMFQEKDYAGAKEQLQAAVGAGQFDEAWRLLALTYLRLQRPDNARSVIEKMIHVRGNTPEYHVLAGTVYYYGDFPDLAIAELHKAIAQDNGAPDAHYYLGLAYLADNEVAGYPRAIQEFRAQMRIAPNDFRSHYMLGYIALQQRNFADAESELRRAADLNPQDAGSRLLLGQMYSESDRDAQSEQVLKKLIASSGASKPDFRTVRAHYMLGRILQQTGHLEEGVKEIKEAEKLRQQLRSDSQETPANRDRSLAAAQSANSDRLQAPTAQANSKEQEKTRAFVGQLSPLIAEAYYNLAKISSGRQDPATATRYSARAVEWDPSLGVAQRH